MDEKVLAVHERGTQSTIYEACRYRAAFRVRYLQHCCDQMHRNRVGNVLGCDHILKSGHK
jgi:hypothetical protein